MDRLRAAFLVVLVVSVSLGGLAVADFGDRLRTTSTLADVRPQVGVTATDAAVRDERVAVSFRIHNPTRFPLHVRGAKLRIHNGTERRIASSAGRRVDDNGSVVPPKGSLTVTYEIPVTDAARRNVRSALRDDAMVSVSFGMEYNGQQFSLTRADMALGGESR